MYQFACRLVLPLALLAAWALPALAQSTDELFDDSQLHEIRLLLNSNDWARLKADFSSNTYYPADLEWRDVKVRNIGIRSRGLGTRNEFKPGLRVDMNRYASGQRFLGMRSLLLDNVYRDQSLMRERVSMKLFARLGLPVPRESHTRLYVNNEFVGVYAITEELGEDFVRRVFKKPESDEPDKGTLFEYKWIDEWNFGYLGAELEAYKTRFEARTHENDSMVDLYGSVEELVRSANQSPVDRYLEDVDALVDLRKLMVYMGVEAFLADYDGLVGYKGMANFYLYRPEDSRQALFIPWDKDQTFYNATRDIGHGLGNNELLRRALDVPELRAVFLDALERAANEAEALAEGASLPWMEGELVRGRDQIRASVVTDPGRWFSVNDFDDEVNRMIEFARTRPVFVRCQVDQWRHPGAPPRDCAAR
ncbi:MAG: CotH kinase family protein [Acidobacteria bacterium]|nr:CotH kinase family protein [Acidobacteriota bacterium]